MVGAITPWNFPFEVTLAKLGQALATGNTVVLKPAPDTPWNATLIGRLVAERTDFPAGVVNVVTSSDHLVGEELTLSPQVDLISFTGSTAVGKRIMEKGAATMKRLFLELGGKSATIVLDDADFDSALLMGLAVCSHAGQGCAIPTRMLLPRSRYEEGVERLTSYLGMVPYGDPQRADVMMGPLISDKQRNRVLGYIETGDPGGSHPGRRRRSPEGPAQGVLRRADHVHRRGQFDDHRPGGDLRPGARGHSLRGRRRRRPHRQPELLRTRAVPSPRPRWSGRWRWPAGCATGTMGVNGGMWYGADVPFGGYKDCGVGRQNGIAGFNQYLEVKSIAWPSA